MLKITKARYQYIVITHEPFGDTQWFFDSYSEAVQFVLRQVNL